MYGRSKVHFSPWIEDIGSIDNIPTEFQGYYEENSNFEKIYAVPYDIETFSHLIALYDSYIYFLIYKNRKIESLKCDYKDILYVKWTKILLMTKLEIVTIKEKIEFTCSSVSKDIIEKIISKIRKNYVKNNSDYSYGIENKYDSNKLKFFFRNILNSCIKQDKEICVLASQRDYSIPKAERNILMKLFIMISSPVLLSSMYIQTKKELLIHDSGKTFKKRNEANYGHSVIYLPLENIKSVYQSKNRRFETLSDINIEIENTKFSFPFEAANMEREQLENRINKLIN